MSLVVERRTLLLRGVLDLCLLALLRDQPVYGYELTERMGEWGIPVSGGSAYPLLARLVKQGLVRTETRPSTSGPPRKYYSLTGRGRLELETGSAEWHAVSNTVSALLKSNNSTRKTEVVP